jgi:hypothetical protein
VIFSQFYVLLGFRAAAIYRRLWNHSTYLCHVFSMIVHTGSYLVTLNTLFSDFKSLLVIIPHRLRSPSRYYDYFFDIMRSLIVGLTPHNEILLLTFIMLVSLQHLNYISAFIGRFFLNDYCPPYVLMRCWPDVIDFFQIVIAPPYFLCFVVSLKRLFIFSQDSPCTFYVICWVQKWWTTLSLFPFEIWHLKNYSYTQMLIWDDNNFLRTDLCTQPPHESTPIIYWLITYYRSKYKRYKLLFSIISTCHE